MKQLITYLLLLCAATAGAQYAPQAGIAGSTAIPASSSLFTQWATSCTVKRGLVCIDTPTLGYVTNGDSSLATGSSDRMVVSLGDSGIATLTFPGFLFNGAGADFAVFENGFINPSNDSQAFLELAFVEVSSDGEHFFRFPSSSNIQHSVQIRGSGDYMYANLINNLAGKYGAGFGTPFNLDDLSGISELDINKVTTIRLIDVIGSIGMSGCNDNSGLKINDPFPTNFPTGGFDLDAVGAIHFMAHTSVMEHATPVVSIFPNPCTDQLNINVLPGRYTLSLYGIAGNAVFTGQFTDNICVATGKLATGVYYARITDENGIQWLERVVKY